MMVGRCRLTSSVLARLLLVLVASQTLTDVCVIAATQGWDAQPVWVQQYGFQGADRAVHAVFAGDGLYVSGLISSQLFPDPVVIDSSFVADDMDGAVFSLRVEDGTRAWGRSIGQASITTTAETWHQQCTGAAVLPGSPVHVVGLCETSSPIRQDSPVPLDPVGATGFGWDAFLLTLDDAGRDWDRTSSVVWHQSSDPADTDRTGWISSVYQDDHFYIAVRTNGDDGWGTTLPGTAGSERLVVLRLATVSLLPDWSAPWCSGTIATGAAGVFSRNGASPVEVTDAGVLLIALAPMGDADVCGVAAVDAAAGNDQALVWSCPTPVTQPDLSSLAYAPASGKVFVVFTREEAQPMFVSSLVVLQVSGQGVASFQLTQVGIIDLVSRPAPGTAVVFPDIALTASGLLAIAGASTDAARDASNTGPRSCHLIGVDPSAGTVVQELRYTSADDGDVVCAGIAADPETSDVYLVGSTVGALATFSNAGAYPGATGDMYAAEDDIIALRYDFDDGLDLTWLWITLAVLAVVGLVAAAVVVHKRHPEMFRRSSGAKASKPKRGEGKKKKEIKATFTLGIGDGPTVAAAVAGSKAAAANNKDGSGARATVGIGDSKMKELPQMGLQSPGEQRRAGGSGSGGRRRGSSGARRRKGSGGRKDSSVGRKSGASAYSQVEEDAAARQTGTALPSPSRPESVASALTLARPAHPPQ